MFEKDKEIEKLQNQIYLDKLRKRTRKNHKKMDKKKYRYLKTEPNKILISSIDGKIYCTTNCVNIWVTIYIPKLYIMEKLCLKQKQGLQKQKC